MARVYEGSVLRSIRHRAAYHFKRRSKDIKSRFAPSQVPAEISGKLQTYDRLVAQRNWTDLRPTALDLALYAERHNDAVLMAKMVRALLLLGDYGRAADLRLARVRLLNGVDPKAWDGGDISDKHLLISLLNNRNIGGMVSHATIVPHAARHAARTTVVTEPRLVPLFDRSFEGVEVIAPDDLDDDGSYDKTATVHNLVAIFSVTRKQ